MTHTLDARRIVPIGGEASGLPLLCLPYAGGAASAFRIWAGHPAPHVRLLALELPGRGRRMSEPPCGSIADVVEDLMPTLAGYAEQPFGLLGHSMGGLLAFELAHECRKRFRRAPELLVISATPAPSHEPLKHRPLDGPTVLKRLKALGATPPEVLANQDLMNLLLPMLTADFQIVEDFALGAREPLSCPLGLLAGDRDETAPALQVEGWAAQTSGPIMRHVFEGGHFFLRDQPAESLDVVDRMAAALTPAGVFAG